MRHASAATAVLVVMGTFGLAIPVATTADPVLSDTDQPVVTCSDGRTYDLVQYTGSGTWNAFALYQMRQTPAEIAAGAKVRGAFAWNNNMPGSVLNQHWYLHGHSDGSPPGSHSTTLFVEDDHAAGNPCEHSFTTNSTSCAGLTGLQDGPGETYEWDLRVSQSIVGSTAATGWSVAVTQTSQPDQWAAGINVGITKTGPSGSASLSYTRGYESNSYSRSEAGEYAMSITAYPWRGVLGWHWGGDCLGALLNADTLANKILCVGGGGVPAAFVPRSTMLSPDGTVLAWTMVNGAGDLRLGWEKLAEDAAPSAFRVAGAAPGGQAEESDAKATSRCGGLLFEGVGAATALQVHVGELAITDTALSQGTTEALFLADVADDGHGRLSVIASGDAFESSADHLVQPGSGTWQPTEGQPPVQVTSMSYDFKVHTLNL
ncbi:MAG: hypothetical protein QOD77_2048 [Thermoplasmata archaeon]|jgi:hypothetical protein|nr:hypothetical protein [Thermoplasmata archaeon]